MPAPEPFTMNNFAFASCHLNENNDQPQMGSLYFYTEDHYRRIRLTHRRGPEVGSDYPDRICYFSNFSQSEDEYGDIIENCPLLDMLLELGSIENPIMSNVINLAEKYDVTQYPTEGYRIAEFWSCKDEEGNINLCIHSSRGVVYFPVIYQGYIDVIYDAIINLYEDVYNNNQSLATTIEDAINSGILSEDFRQYEY